MDSYSGEKQKEAMWTHHFVILHFFHAKYKKVPDIHFVHSNQSLFVHHFNHERNRNIQTSLKTCLPLSICGWVRGFSLVRYNSVTT